jgi:hypothetical protein
MLPIFAIRLSYKRLSPENTPPATPPEVPGTHLALPQGLALPPTLSERLETIVESFQDRSVSFRELYQVAEGGAFSFILILLNLPYIIPIPIPGLSVITGIVTAIIGVRMALRKKPWLPERVLNAKLPARFFPTLLKGAVKVLRACEHLLRPRLRFVHEGFIFHHLNGTIITLCGLLLVLPFPFFIPLTNFFPAVPILLIAAGTMERDGVFVLAGYAVFAVTICYFTFLSLGGVVILERLFHQIWP